MQSDEAWRLGNRPQLDGIRGLALLSVVLGHCGIVAIPAAGAAGVSMFFALSGFLITVLLLEEHQRAGGISLTRFYQRRALRLLPALLFFLAVMALLSLLSDKASVPSGRDLLGSLFYVGNYTTGMQGRDNALLHTWSLAVEEQFYILWPLLMVGVLVLSKGRTRSLAVLAGAASLLAVLLRAALWDGGDGRLRVYFGTDTRMDCLLLGALTAVWMHSRPPGRNRPWVVAAALVGIGGLCFGGGSNQYLVVPFLVPLLTVVAIWASVQQSASSALTPRWLVLVGRRSYGLYLWHFPLFGAAATLQGPSRWLTLVAAAALTVALAHLSWRCIEEPFLVRKARLSPPARVDSRPTAPVSFERDVTLRTETV